MKKSVCHTLLCLSCVLLCGSSLAQSQSQSQVVDTSTRPGFKRSALIEQLNAISAAVHYSSNFTKNYKSVSIKTLKSIDSLQANQLLDLKSISVNSSLDGQSYSLSFSQSELFNRDFSCEDNIQRIKKHTRATAASCDAQKFSVTY